MYGEEMSDEAWTPMLFVKVRSRARMIAEARNSGAAAEQCVAVEQWAARQGRALTEPMLAPRTRARYRLERDSWLRGRVESTTSAGRMLVIDDVFRFVDGCDAEEAEQIMTGLLSVEPPIFSIQHGAPFLELAPGTYRHEVVSRVRYFRKRSERAKRAAADPGNPQRAPSPRARRAAAHVRGRIADLSARRLIQQIDRVRASLPTEDREALSAIARALNEAEIATPSGHGKWQGTTVKRVLERAAQSSETCAREAG